MYIILDQGRTFIIYDSAWGLIRVTLFCRVILSRMYDVASGILSFDGKITIFKRLLTSHVSPLHATLTYYDIRIV